MQQASKPFQEEPFYDTSVVKTTSNTAGTNTGGGGGGGGVHVLLVYITIFCIVL